MSRDVKLWLQGAAVIIGFVVAVMGGQWYLSQALADRVTHHELETMMQTHDKFPHRPAQDQFYRIWDTLNTIRQDIAVIKGKLGAE